MGHKIKVTPEQLEYFKARCEEYRKRFGLTNWEVYYVLGKTVGRCVTTAQLSGYIATISLTKKWDSSVIGSTDKELQKSAKHEMLHLLLARMSVNANNRFIQESDLYESEEEVVRMLENLIEG